MTGAARIGWHADRYDPSLASIRYRLLEPLAALRASGVAIERFDAAREYEAIIFSKSQGERALALAEAMRAANRPVVYDLCDNLFAAHEAGHVGAARLDRVRRLLLLATHLSFSTATLAEQIAAAVPGLSERRVVIPDVLDTDPVPAPGPLGWRDRREWSRLRRFLDRHSAALHCVWFGKSLGRASGYVHLERAVDELERFAARHPVTLTVISNARIGYWLASRRWRVPAHYMPWSLATDRQALARHRVALIPVEANDYTAGKTINRPATALLAGLGVVADTIPSYRPLADFIALDDWQGGLECYRRWSPDSQERLAAGRRFLAEHYRAEAVADRWRALIDTL